MVRFLDSTFFLQAFGIRYPSFGTLRCLFLLDDGMVELSSVSTLWWLEYMSFSLEMLMTFL